MASDTVKIQDRVLLRRAVREKDRNALGRLHTIYYTRLKRYIASRIDSIPDAEDLAQSVFFKLCKDDSTCKEYQDAEAYLFGIAKNLIALYRRSQSKQVKTIPIESVGELAAGGDVQQYQEPAEQVSQQELRDIKDLIAQLPPKAQETISLRFTEGLSPKDAAKKAGCPVDMFYRRFYEGLKALRARSSKKTL